MRIKRLVGMLITEMVALITVITTAATATVALEEGIHTSNFVNEVVHNVSVAFNLRRTGIEISNKD